MRHLLIATTATLLGACTPPSAPACEDPGLSSCDTGLVDVAVLDRTTGERLTVYSHAGQRWVAGTPGHRYAISLRSRWSGRILGVVSVDGVNAVSGETASWGQRGYVLAPWESFDVLGWRKSQDHVADFVFSSLDDSYAARTGRPRDVGVIGLAVFREAGYAPPPAGLESAPSASRRDMAPIESRQSGPAAGSANDPAAEAPAPQARIAPESDSLSKQRLGTAHGPGEMSKVLTTRFERAQDRPDEVISIRYDSRVRLAAMGVIPGSEFPRPFPRSASAGFVPDPPSRW